ncbi:hypothetical protein [Halopseudomonas pelagia]|uniref:hypothetical protein n=1 Tax=Halopseudomonas pelagia TaxID=553151 RepID=UPI0003A53D10|nr:hypothetical protein [Halopseudomonas pelagia]
MLNAVLSGKKRGTGLQNMQTTLEQAEGAEDALTASVFERLAYLPDNLFTNVFTELLGQSFGPLQSIEYWPSWFLKDGKRVEPDVLLQDAQHSLLVEAKRHDVVRQQNVFQLAQELESGWEQDALSDNCILLTLGGLKDYSEKGQDDLLKELLPLLPTGSAERFTLVCRSWQQLYQALEANLPPDSPPGCLRLLDDVASCYAWHRLRAHPMRWLNNLQPVELKTAPGAFTHWRIK